MSEGCSNPSKVTHFEICRFIREISLKLEVKPKVTVTALLTYHSVYKWDQMATFDEISPYTVATGCVWLAIKGDFFTLHGSHCNMISSQPNFNAT